MKYGTFNILNTIIEGRRNCAHAIIIVSKIIKHDFEHTVENYMLLVSLLPALLLLLTV